MFLNSKSSTKLQKQRKNNYMENKRFPWIQEKFIGNIYIKKVKHIEVYVKIHGIITKEC